MQKVEREGFRRAARMRCAVSWALCFAAALPAATMPDEWVDEETGHRVVRLSRREGNNWMFYFHQNPFTAEGDKMVFTGSCEKGRGAFVVDLESREVEPLVVDRSIGFEAVAPERRELFYLSGGKVHATHIDTKETREIGILPEKARSGRGFSVNADETQLLGCYAEGESAYYKLPREEWFEQIFEAKLPNALYTVDIETGAYAEFYHENAWFGHGQFSPADPGLVLFCHEGPERKLHRMWLVRTDDAAAKKLFPTTVPNTFVTHELWAPDGRGVWFDLQLPPFLPRFDFIRQVIPPKTYLAYVDIDSGEVRQYRLKRNQYSWHYNISRDGAMLCGDGEGRHFEITGRANWVNLYRPQGERMEVERLCSLRGHSYDIAPNAHFTPDGCWVVFNADMHGSPQVYAVEIAGGR